MHDHLLAAYVHVRAGLVARRAWMDERGEGVISAAIAVLVMAFLGAGMWLAFDKIFDNTAKSTCEQTARIGGSDAGGSADCAGVATP